MNNSGFLCALGTMLALSSVSASGLSVEYDTSAEFAPGTFANVEDTGSGSSPALKIVNDLLPYETNASFGDGRNGSTTISGDPNARAACSGSGTTLSTTLTGNAGDIVLVYQTTGTGAGNWELNKIVTANGSTMTLASSLSYTYTTSGISKAQVIRVPQYSSLTISGGGPAAWNGSVGGIYAVMCSGTVTVSGTLSATGAGFRGGAYGNKNGGGTQHGGQGEGYNGTGTRTNSANANGGGGGITTTTSSGWCGGSGGGGGHNGAGTNGQAPAGSGASGGTGGISVGGAPLRPIYLGGGGGGGGADTEANSGRANGGAGGNGGGIIMIFAKDVSVTGLITTNGNKGANADPWTGNNEHGAGGSGGAGGSILVKCRTANWAASKLTAVGGGGGSPSWEASCAGVSGAAGRIHVEYLSGSPGASSPAFTTVPLAYKTAGTYLSAPINTPGAFFGTLQWTASGGTSISFRTRTASSSANLNSATWSDPLTSSGQQITSSPNDWVQFEASFAGTTSSTPSLSAVTINYLLNQYPTDPAFQTPADGAYLNNNHPLCTWSASTDADGDPITYHFTLSTASDLSNPIVDAANTGTTTSYQCPTLDDGTYYWRAVAWDTKDYNENPATWSFTVDTVAPDAISLDSMSCALATGKISQISGNGQNGTTLTFKTATGTTIPGNTSWDGNGAYAFTPTSPLNPGVMLYASSIDLAGNITYSRMWTLSFDAFRDVHPDTQVAHGGSGTSMRLEQDTQYTFKLAVNAGQQVTISAWLRKNAAYTGTAPSITLTGLGITGSGSATASLSAGADTWQQLNVTGTPNAAGMLTLTVQTFSTAIGAEAWIDDIAVSQ